MMSNKVSLVMKVVSFLIVAIIPLSQISFASAFLPNQTSKNFVKKTRSSLGRTYNDYDSCDKNDDESEGYDVEIVHEGKRTHVRVRPDESILAALERNRIHDALAIPSLPHDCRRGVCLTCTGKHSSSSKKCNLKSTDHGWNDHNMEILNGDDYVLTCSSTIVGPGVKLELEHNHDLWKDIYSNRFHSNDDERIRLEVCMYVCMLVHIATKLCPPCV